VVYDDHFTTVANQEDEVTVPPNWEDLFNLHSVRLIEPETELHPDMTEEERLKHLAPPLADEWLTDEERAARNQRENPSSTAAAPTDQEGEDAVDVNDGNVDVNDKTVSDDQQEQQPVGR